MFTALTIVFIVVLQESPWLCLWLCYGYVENMFTAVLMQLCLLQQRFSFVAQFMAVTVYGKVTAILNLFYSYIYGCVT